MDDDTLMREWARGPFRLELHELPGRSAPLMPEGHTRIGYRFFHDGQLIFESGDIRVPPDQSLDGDQTVRGVLGFLALRPGSVEPDYFAGYTPARLPGATSMPKTSRPSWPNGHRSNPHDLTAPPGLRVRKEPRCPDPNACTSPTW